MSIANLCEMPPEKVIALSGGRVLRIRKVPAASTVDRLLWYKAMSLLARLDSTICGVIGHYGQHSQSEAYRTLQRERGYRRLYMTNTE